MNVNSSGASMPMIRAYQIAQSDPHGVITREGITFIACADTKKKCAALALRTIGEGCVCLFWAMTIWPIMEEAAGIRPHQTQFLPRFGMTEAEMPSDLSARPIERGVGRPSHDATTRIKTGIGRSHYFCVSKREDRVKGGPNPENCRR